MIEMTNPKIMLVEDDSFMLLFLTQIFTAANYEVYPVNKYSLALEAAIRFQPDVIVLDIALDDGYTGYDVSEQLKSNFNTKDIPTIFVTAEVDEAARCKAFLSGGIDFLRKPFNKEDLLNRVKPLAMIGKMSKMLSNLTKKKE